jgi:phosphate transport system substrate-binding protein
VRTSRIATSLLLAGVLLAAAACSSSKKTASSPTSAAPAPTTAASSAPAAPATTAAASGPPAAAGSAPACATGTLSAQGSTFQANMETQWSKDFGTKCSGAKINYQGTGSGAGITAIGNGTADFAGSDVTMAASEQTAANTACGSTALTIPITAGGIAVTYNLSGVTSLKLSAPTIAGIFDGKIAKWNDPAIVADNSGATLPSTPISVFYRNDSSGSTSVFTSFLKADAPTDWTLGASKTITFFSGAQGAKGSAGVAAGVKQTSGGITYVETSFAKAQSLPTASIKGEGDYQAATSATVSTAIGEGFSVVGTGSDLAGMMNYAKMATGYPISTVSYAIVCSKYKDAAKGSLVKSYLGYAVTTGQAAADGLGFAPLPSDLAAKALASITAIS